MNVNAHQYRLKRALGELSESPLIAIIAWVEPILCPNNRCILLAIEAQFTSRTTPKPGRGGPAAPPSPPPTPTDRYRTLPRPPPVGPRRAGGSTPPPGPYNRPYGRRRQTSARRPVRRGGIDPLKPNGCQYNATVLSLRCITNIRRGRRGRAGHFRRRRGGGSGGRHCWR